MSKYRKPYKVKKKKSVLKSRLFWRVVLGLVFAGASFYFFFLSSVFQIKEINISGNQKVKTEAIEEMIKMGNIFLVNLDAAKKEILEKFPQIAKVNLKRKFPDKIIGKIEERKAAAIFCQDNNCFSVDKYGVIFEPALENSQLIKIFTETGSLSKSSLVSSILDIESRMKDDFQIIMKEILIVSASKLNVRTSEGWEIYFDSTKDLDWQTTKLKAILEQEIPPERRKNLEYIDLRFGNLASYKYR